MFSIANACLHALPRFKILAKCQLLFLYNLVTCDRIEPWQPHHPSIPPTSPTSLQSRNNKNTCKIEIIELFLSRIQEASVMWPLLLTSFVFWLIRLIKRVSRILLRCAATLPLKFHLITIPICTPVTNNWKNTKYHLSGISEVLLFH